ncbi:ferrichrome transport system permease protein FhuB [Vibrio sp. JCM 19053]|nr:ferrichrome transport system permease protein FhuB [Vibrio sp. JCM 19053]
MTLLVGAMLGLTGSLMQQLTQNNLTSPLTLGTSSGAWLALVVVNIWFVDWVADYSALAAMVGALVAFGLIVSIAGVRNMTGLPLVVSGMVINILLGSIATAIIILNAQFAQNIFMWGAGDLSQYSWDWFEWLLPRCAIAIVILIVAPRILTLMKLGQEGAAARGLAVLPAFGALMVMGIWLVSAQSPQLALSASSDY